MRKRWGETHGDVVGAGVVKSVEDRDEALVRILLLVPADSSGCKHVKNEKEDVKE